MQKIDKYIIEIENAYVIYNYKQPSEFIGLKNFSYQFQKDKIYCIIGKSGSGKSTLISLFNGLNRLNYGKIKLDSINLNSAKNLNCTFLNYYKINDLNFLKKITKNQQLTCCDNYYLIKLAKDAKPIDINSLLLALNNNQSNKYYKISKNELQTLNIKNNYNKFIVAYINQNEAIKHQLTDQINELNEVNKTLIKISGIHKTRRIKQYKQLRREIGMVSQFPEFQLFKYTVIDDVSFGLRVLGTKKQAALELAKKELLKLGIKESHFNNSPFALSGGQKRRVAIAGVLAINGNTLIFDEPTAGLDPNGEKEMINIIKNAHKEHKNIFVVSHSMDQVLEIADEILVIHEGELIAHGEPYDIFNNKNVLMHTNIEQPYVIKMINELSKKNKKFIKLNEYKPRTIEELSNCLIKINKGK